MVNSYNSLAVDIERIVIMVVVAELEERTHVEQQHHSSLQTIATYFALAGAARQQQEHHYATTTLIVHANGRYSNLAIFVAQGCGAEQADDAARNGAGRQRSAVRSRPTTRRGMARPAQEGLGVGDGTEKLDATFQLPTVLKTISVFGKCNIPNS
uniref:Uncharacterized protein n=1 Tax=Oryza brachyantha TaxID=4533 RepID=J3MVM3_ORYBR